MRRSTRLVPVLGTLIAFLAAAACESSPSEPGPDEAPDLPPLASMQADVSIFNAANQAAAIDASASSSVGIHFVTAAATVTLARAATVIAMTLPVAVFAAAASNTPVYDSGDDAFHWRYMVAAGGITFEADLSGYAMGVQSIWAMRVSRTGSSPLDDFLWYDGRANLDGTGGEWHVYDASAPSSGTEILEIDWTHPNETSWSLTFTNVNPSAEQVGDQLVYEVDGELKTVRYLDASALAQIEIQWSTATGAGYIEAPNYNNGARACWDTNFDNAACS